jgi:hypothetical protein
MDGGVEGDGGGEPLERDRPDGSTGPLQAVSVGNDRLADQDLPVGRSR